VLRLGGRSVAALLAWALIASCAAALPAPGAREPSISRAGALELVASAPCEIACEEREEEEDDDCSAERCWSRGDDARVPAPPCRSAGLPLYGCGGIGRDAVASHAARGPPAA
jgi:hypothetical protein